jgi:uncharacterized protein DUF5330
MFFIKLAFWLGLVVLLMPTDAQQQARLYHTATAAVERATTFCDRNAKTCATAAETWATFLKKAEFGARLVGDLISSSGRQSQDAAQPPRHNTSANSSEPRGTLSAADMQPAWRAPSARRTGT